MASRTSWNMLRKDMKRFPCLYPVSQLQLGEKMECEGDGRPPEIPSLPRLPLGGCHVLSPPPFPSYLTYLEQLLKKSTRQA